MENKIIYLFIIKYGLGLKYNNIFIKTIYPKLRQVCRGESELGSRFIIQINTYTLSYYFYSTIILLCKPYLHKTYF